MGARAHGRRREGRASSRNWRRLAGITAGIERARAEFHRLGITAIHTSTAFDTMTSRVAILFDSNARPLGRAGSAVVFVEAGIADHPKKGGEAARAPFQGLPAYTAWIDETQDMDDGVPNHLWSPHCDEGCCE